MKRYQDLIANLEKEGKRFVFSPDFVAEGSTYSPTKMIIPNAVPPQPEKSPRMQIFFKGEDVVFVLPLLRPGESGKLTLGHVMKSSAPVFEKVVVQAEKTPVTVVIPGSETRSWDKGSYLWDFFRFTGGTKRTGAQMVASGSIQIQETVGARTLYRDPSVTDVKPSTL